MNIQEALKAAGPGGKIRRECWCTPEFWIVPNDSDDIVMWDGGVSARIHPEDILADDWQIFNPEPEIEVGDVVKYKEKGKCGGDPDCEVICHFNGQFYALRCIGQGCCVCNTAAPADLTLIRKGKRHVFEGVKINDDGVVMKKMGEGILAMDYWPDGYSTLFSNGKTYTMTLEEVDDERI